MNIKIEIIEMNTIVEELITLGRDVKILYIEDNKGLRESIVNLLTKFFPHLDYAENAEKGYEQYCKNIPDILLTDIKMPGMSGFDLAKMIKADNSDVRILFLSAFDEKEYLHEAIEIGAFRYLSKPTKVPVLIAALHAVVVVINNERHKRIFEKQMSDIFNYQNNLIMMLDQEKPILVNRQFLDFFGVKTLDEFMQLHGGLTELLLEHQGFLYSTSETGWFEAALQNPGKLFHTKVLNYDSEARHLIMKLRTIPYKEGFIILSFDDISDLNLMMIFDGNTAKKDQKFQDCSAVMKLMNVIKENGSEVKLHNFYRGLTIVNSAVLLKMEEKKIVLKTAYSQLKAIKLAKNITVTSELFPYSVLCKVTNLIDFDQQTVTFSDMQFVHESADQRVNIRLELDEERHSATLFRNEIKFLGKTRIIDISICSLKVELDAMPAGFAVGDMAKLAVVLESYKQPLSLSISGSVYRIDTLSKTFHIVFLFELSSVYHDKLLDYIAKRQLELIREFKAL
ncbi:MAG: response regulator [Sulfuricurvum sp.]|nr:response regulator [Sulfuricurvum sp.]